MASGQYSACKGAGVQGMNVLGAAGRHGRFQLACVPVSVGCGCRSTDMIYVMSSSFSQLMAFLLLYSVATGYRFPVIFSQAHHEALRVVWPD